jgi:hypothetical protein
MEVIYVTNACNLFQAVGFFGVKSKKKKQELSSNFCVLIRFPERRKKIDFDSICISLKQFQFDETRKNVFAYLLNVRFSLNFSSIISHIILQFILLRGSV